MHQGQRVKIAKMLCPISQITKTSAPARPRLNSIQYQRANRAPARMLTPTAIGATNPASPMMRVRESEDRSLPGAEVLPALTSALMLQFGTKFGFFSNSILSSVSENAAHHPSAPAMMRKIGKIRGRRVRSAASVTG